MAVNATARTKSTPPTSSHAAVHEFVIRRQELLEHYLGRREGGNLVEKSVQGSMLERIEMASTKCPRCKGHGVLGVEEMWEAESAKAQGLEFDWSKIPFGFGETCPSDGGCGGTGVKPKSVARPSYRACKRCWVASQEATQGSDRPEAQWAEYRRLVEEHGCDRSPTVKRTGQLVEPIGRAVQEVALLTYGLGSRMLREVQLRSEVSAMALMLYYGDTGARCVAQFGGRLFAVYPLTIAGQALLKRTQDRRGKADPWQRIHDLTKDSTAQRVAINALMDSADEQAWRIMRAACQHWDEVSQGVG